ncbi:MAG: hypothetical protein ACOCP9_01770 [Halofilum sp. (in: g-proteobacteria)]
METLYIIGFVVLLIAITVVPVMIAAKWARARRSGFLPALAAVILATVVVQVALALTGDALIGLVLALVGACAVYALVLGTSFVAAVGIAVVAVILQALIVAALVALGLQMPFPVAGPI